MRGVECGLRTRVGAAEGAWRSRNDHTVGWLDWMCLESVARTGSEAGKLLSLPLATSLRFAVSSRLLLSRSHCRVSCSVHVLFFLARVLLPRFRVASAALPVPLGFLWCAGVSYRPRARPMPQGRSIHCRQLRRIHDRCMESLSSLHGDLWKSANKTCFLFTLRGFRPSLDHHCGGRHCVALIEQPVSSRQRAN